MCSGAGCSISPVTYVFVSSNSFHKAIHIVIHQALEMPGKYSHSVVLAEYSSRGIIELPSEQQAAYLKTSPYAASHHGRQGPSWSQTPPTPQKRAQSALAYTGPYTPNHPSLKSPQQRVIIDNNADSGTENSSRYYQQRAFTPDVRSRNGVASKGSPQRQPENGPHGQAAYPKMTARPATSRDSTGFRPNAKEERLRVDEFLRDVPNPLKSAGGQSVPVTRNAQPNSFVQKQQHSKSTSQPSAATGPGRLNDSRQTQGVQQQGRRYKEDYTSETAPAEPDFDDFNDSEEVQDSYFEDEGMHGSKTGAPGQMTPPRTPPRAMDSRAQTRPSTLGDHSDIDTLPETITSPQSSHKKVDSMASMSTTSSRGAHAMPRTSKQADSKNSGAQNSASGWALPEIDENSGFTPEIFAQDLKDPSSHTSDENLPRDINGHLMGAVSSGRDVDFTKEEHSESDDDAAIPPDIGRYRDEEDITKSPAIKSKKSEGAIGSASQTPKSRKGGFFSRFRSKSRPRT